MHANESLTFCSSPPTLMFVTEVSLSKAQQHFPGGFVHRNTDSQWIVKQEMFKEAIGKNLRENGNAVFIEHQHNYFI